jgi:cyclophilin family peptidyl-prolyl cis-trans isomerase
MNQRVTTQGGKTPSTQRSTISVQPSAFSVPPSAFRVYPCAACLAVLLGLIVSVGCGTPATTAEPPERSPERAEYDRVFAEWKGFLAELRQLKEEYDRAEPEQRPELKKRYEEKVEKGNVLGAALLDAAVLACVRQPEENQDLADFLLQALHTHVVAEEYEEALRLAQILIDNKVGGYTPYFYAVIAASAVGGDNFQYADDVLHVLDEKQVRLAGRNNPFQTLLDNCRRDLPKLKKAWARERKIREQEKLAGDLPRVLLRTNKGDIELELFENQAPNTVANFISLVEKGFYNGLTFHRVIPLFMAQAGCPNGNGTGGPGYTIKCECTRPDHRLHFRGSLSMARTDQPDTGGSQFFITFRPTPHLDGKHTVFGRVVRGIEVLARLQRREPPPPEEEQFVKVPKADVILEAKVLRKRDHPYEPKIIPDKKPDPLEKEIRPF